MVKAEPKIPEPLRVETKLSVEKPKITEQKTVIVKEQIPTIQERAVEKITLREALLQPAQPIREEKPVLIKEDAPIIIAKRPAPKIIKEKQMVSPVKAAPMQELEQRVITEEPEPVAIDTEPLVQESEFIAEVGVIEAEILAEPLEFEDDTVEFLAEVMEELVVLEQAVIEKPDIQLLKAELPFLVFEAEIKEEHLETEAEPQPIPPVIEQLVEHIATLEPRVAEEPAAILGIVVEKIALLYEATEMAVDSEQVEQELEILCERLLVCLGVEPSPELVKQFVLLLKDDYQIRQMEEIQIIEDEGTHERKPLNTLTDDYQIMPPFWSGLGKYALYASQVA